MKKPDIYQRQITFMRLELKLREQDEQVQFKDQLWKEIKARRERDLQEKKTTIETVFGIIKERLWFRRFSLRGEVETDAEWSLVCLAKICKVV